MYTLMKVRLLTCCLALSAFLGFSAFTLPEDPILALIKKLEEFTKKYPSEKVYLHLDKPYYAIGDHIWFKAYVTDIHTMAPTVHSNVLYVDLIDGNDSLRKQLKLPMESGITWGDFTLSDTLSEGNYRIRAYTQLMRNAGPDFFFDKTLKIGNSWASKIFITSRYQSRKQGSYDYTDVIIRLHDKEGKPYTSTMVNYHIDMGAVTTSRGKQATNGLGEITIPAPPLKPGENKSAKMTVTITMPDKQIITKILPLKKTASDMDIQFFPESGNFVTDLPNRVAFKVVNAQGKGEEVNGIITDNTGNEVTTFESAHAGMGNFYLLPQTGKTYKARFTLKDGREKWVDLPAAVQSGYILSVNNTDTAKVNVKMLLSHDLTNKGDLYLMAHQNGAVYLSVKASGSKNFALTYLPKAKLPSGIVTLTLFNSQLIPVAERIVFIQNPTEEIELHAETLKPTYGKRELTPLSFTGAVGKQPVQANYSVSVTNASVVKPDPENESHILAGLLLTPDLKGYLENPNYYFLSDDAKTKSDLDLLMLTQGWRKINWKALNSAPWPEPSFHAEKELKISGTLTNLSGKPLPRGKVSLFSNSGGLFAVDTLSDENGRFQFDKMQFPDSTKFVVQGRNEKGKKGVNIVLDTESAQTVTPNKNDPDIDLNVNETLKDYLAGSDAYFEELTKRGMLSRTIQLKKVEITGQKKELENSSNLNGGGRADAIITAKDLENTMFLSTYLMGRVAGITIRDGQAYSRASRGPMAIVVDGMPMQDMLLDDLNIQDIESIEILKSLAYAAIYGSQGANGVILITTKRGNSSAATVYAPGVITVMPKGYYSSRQFYSPRYDVNPDPKPDLRTTVYWNPSVSANAQGKFKFDYFNTDEPGTYRIVIEGIDAYGHLARKVFTYDVK